MKPYRLTLDISAENEEVVEPWAVQFLRDRGFNVEAPNSKWESVSEFKDRLGISYGTVATKVRETPNRPNVQIQRGTKSKQIVAILSNPDFDAYCVRNK